MAVAGRSVRFAAALGLAAVFASGCWGQQSDGPIGKWSGTGECNGVVIELLKDGTLVYPKDGTAGYWSPIDGQRIRIHIEGTPDQVVGYTQESPNSITLTTPNRSCVYARL
jgi:hypothetical protein